MLPTKLREILLLSLLFIGAVTDASASDWSKPEKIPDTESWLTTTNDLHGLGAELGYLCTDRCVAIVGLPLRCNKGGEIPILASFEWNDPDLGGDSILYGALTCDIPGDGEEQLSIMSLIIFRDEEDHAEELVALASRIGIALALQDDLKFQAYRFSLDGSLEALAGAIARMGAVSHQTSSGEF